MLLSHRLCAFCFGCWPVSLSCSDEGLAGCSETWVFAWLLAHALALLVPFHPEVCASLSVELGRKREAWLQPTCLLWADQPGYLSLEQDSQFQDWHTWARLSRHKKDLVNEERAQGARRHLNSLESSRSGTNKLPTGGPFQLKCLFFGLHPSSLPTFFLVPNGPHNYTHLFYKRINSRKSKASFVLFVTQHVTLICVLATGCVCFVLTFQVPATTPGAQCHQKNEWMNESNNQPISQPVSGVYPIHLSSSCLDPCLILDGVYSLQ